MRVNHHHRDDEGGVRRDVDKSANAAVEERKAFEGECNASKGRAKKGRSKISRIRRRRRRRRRRLSSSREQRRERRRRQRGEHENSHAGGHEQGLQRVPVALAVGKSERFQSRFQNVKFDHMIPFDLFNVPWVLFRTKGKLDA